MTALWGRFLGVGKHPRPVSCRWHRPSGRLGAGTGTTVHGSALSVLRSAHAIPATDPLSVSPAQASVANHSRVIISQPVLCAAIAIFPRMGHGCPVPRTHPRRDEWGKIQAPDDVRLPEGHPRTLGRASRPRHDVPLAAFEVGCCANLTVLQRFG